MFSDSLLQLANEYRYDSRSVRSDAESRRLDARYTALAESQGESFAALEAAVLDVISADFAMRD